MNVRSDRQNKDGITDSCSIKGIKKRSVMSNIRSNTGRELLPLMMITMSKSEESINILYNPN